MNRNQRPTRTLAALGAAVALTLAACGGDDDEPAAEPAAEPAVEVAMSPASLTLADQDGDGTSVLVGIVELPAAGFIAVHGDGGGSPGPVIGVSDLLPAGTTSEVTVDLEEPLTETGVVFPMVHIDTDANGIYEFGTVEGVDGPGTTADGDVAVGPVTITIAANEPADEGAAPAMSPSAITFEAQESNGSMITIAAVELPAAGFVAVHADGGGSPGPVIGVSDLLPAGASTEVMVMLSEPLSGTATVFPMVHIDTDGNGIYEFGTAEGVDGPGTTADGDVAVVGGDVTVTDDGTSAAPAEGDTITIADFAFSGITEVAVGTTVVVTNTDGSPHTWTAVDGTFDSGALAQGDTFEFTFTQAGEFAYFCNFHPSMQGTITVTG